jgi:heterogeneous nuclear ribonucleoprotein F/H
MEPHLPGAEGFGFSVTGDSKESQTADRVWGSVGAVGMPPMQTLNAAQGEGGQRYSGDGGLVGDGDEGAAGRGGMAGGPQMKRPGGGIQVGDHTGFLRMRGLPFSATKEEIFKFFAIYNPVLESIVLTFRSDGRATGEAYVGFETTEDSKQAMDLHRKSMGNRYIELFLSNKEEHGRALARFGNR